MNPKILLYAALTLLSLSCGQNNRKADKEQTAAIAMLTEFYTLYITENSKMPPDTKALDAIKNKYLSKELREKLMTAEYESDPFLNAQDCSTDWIKSIEISKDGVRTAHVGPDQFGLPCVELSEEINGKSRAICLLPFTNYLKLRNVSEGEEVVMEGEVRTLYDKGQTVVVKHCRIVS